MARKGELVGSSMNLDGDCGGADNLEPQPPINDKNVLGAPSMTRIYSGKRARVNDHSKSHPDDDDDDDDDDEEEEEETDDEVTVEELEKQLVGKRKRLEVLRKLQQRQSKAQDDEEKQHRSQERARRKKGSRTQSAVLKYLLNMIDAGEAEGFVYGIVLENGKTMSASSDGLRTWWKEKVKFADNGLHALAKSQGNNDFPSSSTSDDKSALSTPDLLNEIQSKTLGSLISALTPHCNPSSRHYPLKKKVPPPWWPDGKEDWWPELGFSESEEPPPYKKPHDLKKAWRVCVLTAVIKHMSSNTGEVRSIIKNFRNLQESMSYKDSTFWSFVVDKEEELYNQLNQNSPPRQPSGRESMR